MDTVKIPLKLIRKIILDAQLLYGNTGLSWDKKGITQVIDKIGYIQIDTIAVIKRSHHHTLRTRRNDYQERMPRDLQAKDRHIFEYWAHAMSYLPMSDYRFFIPRMWNFFNPKTKWARYQMEQAAHLLDSILEKIRVKMSFFYISTSKRNHQRLPVAAHHRY